MPFALSVIAIISKFHHLLETQLQYEFNQSICPCASGNRNANGKDLVHLYVLVFDELVADCLRVI